MTIQLTADQYVVATKYVRNGVETLKEDSAVVDRDWVARFISPETVEFFEGLGGTERLSIAERGVITVISSSPAGDTIRTTVFTPCTPEEN